MVAKWSVLHKAIDRAFKELSELDDTPGADGRQVISVPELYTGLLLVYNYVNRFSPGTHLSPPKKKEVLNLVKKFDTNQDGVLDREEFDRFVNHFAKHLMQRVLINVLIICTVVPFLVYLVSKMVGGKLPESILATVFTTAFKMSGVWN
eukprot:TRINITY_DN4976_c0_g1_i1.p2 TRINITY_DN4976_c0_g1~~TRINITY_DN4976_c0_g1_i1.p2  ORF type:complete len:149 (-),score=27.16 TRINITY_DN4976_c0_g1_i1:335-781(-)